MATIGLIAAMPQESAALLHYIKGWKRIAFGRLDCKSFELNEHNCLLVTSGIGVRRASEVARDLIKFHAPRLLISFGIAGAVETELEIGDVVVPDACCKLEHGMPGPLLPLNPWPDDALKAATFIAGGRGVRLVTGTAVTTGGAQVLEDQLRGLKHPILEMETAGIAQVAAEKGIPLLALRAISDGPRAPIPVDLGVVMDEDGNLKASMLMRAIVRNPRIVFQSKRVIRNSKIAADNAASVLNAALNKLVI
jgi:adenosylhomocysteine nucleosidase